VAAHPRLVPLPLGAPAHNLDALEAVRAQLRAAWKKAEANASQASSSLLSSSPSSSSSPFAWVPPELAKRRLLLMNFKASGGLQGSSEREALCVPHFCSVYLQSLCTVAIVPTHALQPPTSRYLSMPRCTAQSSMMTNQSSAARLSHRYRLAATGLLTNASTSVGAFLAAPLFAKGAVQGDAAAGLPLPSATRAPLIAPGTGHGAGHDGGEEEDDDEGAHFGVPFTGGPGVRAVDVQLSEHRTGAGGSVTLPWGFASVEPRFASHDGLVDGPSSAVGASAVWGSGESSSGLEGSGADGSGGEAALQSKKFETKAQLESFYRAVSTFHFVASPRGNGLDCFRTWEVLALGAIPVVKRSGPHDAVYVLPRAHRHSPPQSIAFFCAGGAMFNSFPL